jgi:hypothetical protein
MGRLHRLSRHVGDSHERLRYVIGGGASSEEVWIDVDWSAEGLSDLDVIDGLGIPGFAGTGTPVWASTNATPKYASTYGGIFTPSNNYNVHSHFDPGQDPWVGAWTGSALVHSDLGNTGRYQGIGMGFSASDAYHVFAGWDCKDLTPFVHLETSAGIRTNTTGTGIVAEGDRAFTMAWDPATRILTSTYGSDVATLTLTTGERDELETRDLVGYYAYRADWDQANAILETTMVKS